MPWTLNPLVVGSIPTRPTNTDKGLARDRWAFVFLGREPRAAMVRAGELTRFREVELSETTVVFGNVAHRFSAYAKSGMMKGIPFEGRGMISSQFVLTPDGWRMSAMAWDDERPGLSIPASALSRDEP